MHLNKIGVSSLKPSCDLQYLVLISYNIQTKFKDKKKPSLRGPEYNIFLEKKLTLVLMFNTSAINIKRMMGRSKVV